MPPATPTLLTTLRRDPALVMWTLYLLLVPIYVFKSGLPQPGDIMIVFLVPVALRGWNGRLPPTQRRVMVALSWFTGWVVLVDLAWAVLTGNYGLVGMDAYLMFPLYYLYNTLLFLCALVLARKHGEAFLRLTTNVVMFTVGFQVLASFVTRSGTRGVVFFNNPNQLGYYALLAACLIALGHKARGSRLWVSGLALTMCGYLSIVSASRAATAGIGILIVLLVFSNPRVIIAASLAIAGMLSLGGPVSDAIEAAQVRAATRSANSEVDFFEERGYDRIEKNPQYLVLGAGEGGLSRFDDTSRIQRMEIHSSAATILFSYGAVGSLLFLWFVWRVVAGARLRAALVLVPPMLYTIAHQGLRFTMLWVLLAVFVALKDPPKKS